MFYCCRIFSKTGTWIWKMFSPLSTTGKSPLKILHEGMKISFQSNRIISVDFKWTKRLFRGTYYIRNKNPSYRKTLLMITTIFVILNSHSNVLKKLGIIRWIFEICSLFLISLHLNERITLFLIYRTSEVLLFRPFHFIMRYSKKSFGVKIMSQKSMNYLLR
jgi:hypothetical protein